MCSVSCIIHRHSSGLASATTASCPLYLPYRPPTTLYSTSHCHDILDIFPLFPFLPPSNPLDRSSPSLPFHFCSLSTPVLLPLFYFRVRSFSRSPSRSFNPLTLPAFLYPSANFACQGALCAWGHVSRPPNNVT